MSERDWLARDGAHEQHALTTCGPCRGWSSGSLRFQAACRRPSPDRGSRSGSPAVEFGFPAFSHATRRPAGSKTARCRWQLRDLPDGRSDGDDAGHGGRAGWSGFVRDVSPVLEIRGFRPSVVISVVVYSSPVRSAMRSWYSAAAGPFVSALRSRNASGYRPVFQASTAFSHVSGGDCCAPVRPRETPGKPRRAAIARLDRVVSASKLADHSLRGLRPAFSERSPALAGSLPLRPRNATSTTPVASVASALISTVIAPCRFAWCSNPAAGYTIADVPMLRKTSQLVARSAAA